MPITRSTKSTAAAAAKGTSSSTNWSMTTPAESSSTAIETTSQSTLVGRTPPRRTGGASPARAVGDRTVPATSREGRQSEVTRAEELVRAPPVLVEMGYAPPPVDVATMREYSRTPQQTTREIIGQHDELLTRIADTEKTRSARVEEIQFALPTSQQSRQTTQHKGMEPRRLNPDVRSVRSSKRAELEAKMQVARRELEAAEARSKMAQMELEMLQLESEEEEEEEMIEEQVRQRHVEQWLEQTDATQEKPSIPLPRPPEERNDIQELAQVIMKLSQTSTQASVSRQMIELPYFNGASEEWLAFRRSYEDTSYAFTPTQNLARLRRSLQGRARDAVKSLLFTAENPEEVMKGLEARFGRPGALALAELEKMKSLPRVQETPTDICTFSSKVRNSVATIKALKKEQYLCSPETLKSLVEKMPANMKYRWYIYQHSRRDTEEKELVLINSFLEAEADMCGDFAPPEVSWEHRRDAPRIPLESSWERKRGAIKKNVHIVQQTKSPEGNIRKECPECKGEHWMYECRKFKEGNTDEKWEMVKKARLCFKCLQSRHSRINCRANSCKKCTRWHHTSLHSDTPPEVRKSSPEASYSTTSKDKEEIVSSVHAAGGGRAYLKVMPVNICGPKGAAQVLALLDEGSTVSLLDSAIAKKIGAEGRSEPITIEMVGGKGIRQSNSQNIQIKIRGLHRRDNKKIQVRTIDDLKLAKQEVSEDIIKKCQHLQGVKEQLIYKEEEPKLLLGQDNWALIVTRRLKKGNKSEPVASLTSLGWVLHGRGTGCNASVNFVNHSRLVEDETEALVRRYFEIESIGVRPQRPSNDADKRALDVLNETTKRLPNGRYESGLLWKSEKEILPHNYGQALRRLINLEKKLDRDEELKASYEEQMENLLNKGYAEKAPPEKTTGRTFYLPHFAVVHPIKKKPRVVLDAAAKTEGKSLNDALLPGPDLLQSLFGVLLRFREGPVAVIADIEEMFLRIQMKETDRDSLRFLWRSNRRNGKPEEYRMKSVIFGATSSPSTAIYVLNKNAEEFKEEYPDALKAIKRNHYMDDYLQSFTTKEEARRVAKEVQEVHSKAGFHLKGWGSNHPEVIEGIQEGHSRKEISMKLATEEKTLGLRWLIKEDSLTFNVEFRNTPFEVLSERRSPTKREVTSAVMTTFDPLGFAAPVLIQGKKLIQDIWRSKIGWDERIQEDHRPTWTKYLKEVAVLKDLKIPRCLSPHQRKGQLHVFTDASEEAYAAAVYWRTEMPDIHIALIAGKAQVTPTKPVSVPRLELQAALLGSRLAHAIEEEIELEVTGKTFWTDSSTVLQWIKSDPRKFKPFVAHRLAEIEELTRPQDWRWVPTRDNPADDATRGTPNEFGVDARWFKGPAFLYEDEDKWPIKRFDAAIINTEEEKSPQTVNLITTVSTCTPDPERYSSWLSLLRTMARVLQFIEEMKKAREKKSVCVTREEEWKPHRRTIQKKKNISIPAAKKVKEERRLKPLEEGHLRRAEEELMKRSQLESFPKEIVCLKNNKMLETSSKLRKIDVYMSVRGVIKLRTRTKKVKIEDTVKNPVVLDGRHKISRLIIRYYHTKFMHGNTATVINEIRQRYWILGLRTTTRKVIHQCQWCKVHKGTPQIPPTGDHPIERLQHHQHPFTCTAVDYFGPMQVTIGRRTEKRWGVLFTCLTTRAVHLELANSLSTSSMIMALRRMAARRGTPKTIFSDNGTNFVGANRELEEAAAQENVRWKFIPPGCPNMGGAWERLVRSVKTALKVILHERSPPEEVLNTLLMEVEHVVNSRPITHLSSDPNDEEALTPNHFLIGRSCGAGRPGEFTDDSLIGKANWKTVQRLTDHFWQRWIKEYLPTLSPRKINGRPSEDPQLGDIVLIVDSSLPRNTWPRGEVVKLYPGPDGRVRVLDVRTPGGVLRRPTRRVVVLVPAQTSPPQDGVRCTAGEIVGDVN